MWRKARTIFLDCFRSSFQLNSNSNKKAQKNVLNGSLLILSHGSFNIKNVGKICGGVYFRSFTATR